MVRERMNCPDDERYMRRCLDLARKGAGRVSPNPMVGCVIVHDGSVIGEGFHERYGGPHAEVHAISSVRDESLLPSSTLYVNLEPCSHYGKTPPCSDLIVKKGIGRVVIGCIDPHEKVAGKGVEKLLRAGIEVRTGVLEQEALQLNAAFVKSHTCGMPLVVQKIAQTVDGRVALENGASRWITGDESRREVHRLRSVYDAVLTTSATVLADDPQLTVRSVEGRNPVRVVLDRSLRLPQQSRVFDTQAPTIVYTSSELSSSPTADRLRDQGVAVHGVTAGERGLDLKEVFGHLHDHERIQSVMVESGGVLASSLLACRLADRVIWFIAPKIFGDDARGSFGPLRLSVPADAPVFRFFSPRMFGPDMCVEAELMD